MILPMTNVLALFGVQLNDFFNVSTRLLPYVEQILSYSTPLVNAILVLAVIPALRDAILRVRSCCYKPQEPTSEPVSVIAMHVRNIKWL